MTNKKRIYFAHPKIKRNIIQSIKDVLEYCDYEVIDPLEITNQDDYNYIPENDWQLLYSCDEVFCFFPKTLAHRMIGTSIEMYWGYIGFKNVTVLSYKNHPFINRYANKVLLSYNEFLDWYL